ncbi:nucleoside triphosphate pyrophosphatase [Thalassotalea maritima]|uniref:Maf family protein n=1 Tax=Thalassotalea maritima TaxID=3242416 RepID=UPI0035284EA4
MTVYLASQSPRRKELLGYLLDDFHVSPADIDESVEAGENPQQYVMRMAKTKAKAGWQKLADKHRSNWVIGSDTVVVHGDNILGKPKDYPDSLRILRMLSATEHQVMTAVCLYNGEQQLLELVITDVEFAALTDAQIYHYWHTGEPQDKAGSYGIQGIGGQFVKRINGSYSNVVGLPLCEMRSLLMKASIKIAGSE